MYLHVDKHVDKAVGNESLLGKLFDQQQEIVKLLSQMIQPTIVPPPGNPIPPPNNPIPPPGNPAPPQIPPPTNSTRPLNNRILP